MVHVDSSLEEKVMVAIAVMKTKVGIKRYKHHGYLGGHDKVNEEQVDEDEEAKRGL